MIHSEPFDPTSELDDRWSAHKSAALLVAVVLLLHAGLAVDVARRYSVTHDEYWHIPIGLRNLQTGRFDYDNLNPPLIRMLAALPLWLTDTSAGDAPPDADPRQLGDAFLEAHADDQAAAYRQHVLRARLPIVILSVLAGVLLATWALQDLGPAAAVLAAVFWSASPMVLGCASLVTTDLGGGALFLAAIWRAWRYAGDPSWPNALWMGCALGLAPLAKFTCVLAVPFAIVTWWLRRVGNADRIRQDIVSTTMQWSAAVVVTLLVINAGYLFRGTGTPLADYAFQSQLLPQFRSALGELQRVPLPLPRDLVEGIDHQCLMLEGNHPIYLDGRWSEHGSPDYFIRAIAYKVPHAYQLAFLLAVLLAATRRGRRHWRLHLAALLPAATLLFMASRSGMQLGLRYIFPAFPLAFLFMSGIAAAPWNRVRMLAVISLAVLALVSVRHHPDHLAYFNELSGGMDSGREHLLDSNIDWGQDLYRLADFVRDEGIEQVGLAYFGMFPPDRLGIDFTIPAAEQLGPGWYAISVNFVQGRPHTIRDNNGDVTYANIGQFSPFRSIPRIATLGRSIDVFYLDAAAAAQVRALMLRQPR